MARIGRPRKRSDEYWAQYDRQYRRKNKSKLNDYSKQWRAEKETPLHKRRYSLTARYGITIEQYDEMLKKQNGRCAVCKIKAPLKKDGTPLYGKKNLAVDHGHMLPGSLADKVRGLLCQTCNRIIIGMIESRRINPQTIVDYLKGRSWDVVLENPYV